MEVFAKVNSLYFSRPEGSWKDTFKNENEMWNAIRDAMKLLTKLGYAMSVRDEGAGLVLEYESADEELGGPTNHWITDEALASLQYDESEDESDE